MLGRRQFLGGCFLSLVISGWAQSIHGIESQSLVQCESWIDQAMQAYNAKDWEAFFKNYARSVSASCTEATFNSLYVDRAHKQYGSYQSRSLLPARSTFGAPVGLLVYQARFSEKNATLTVNFYREDGLWKIQQIRIDP